ncbi:MAG: hypothetical protein H8D55_03550 [Deltaproteobacteria bacterium]|nr:hypothetical protein [Deltaproteobacteria bacterium]
MPRIARMIIKNEPAVYHIISRTALDGLVIGDVENEFLAALIRRLSSVYFAEVLGFCLMGTHFHLLVRMHPGTEFTDDEIKQRFKLYYGDDNKRELSQGQIPLFRLKWASLSEYVKEIKQGFSRFYNKLHNRKGFFWAERFKSVIVENGDTLINCLAYIDLNPVRAGIVKRPEEYRFCSLGYHVQTGNKDRFLSLDFGLAEFGVKGERERLKYYRKFVYEKGDLDGLDKEKERDFQLNQVDRFRYRTRYFTDSGIIGTKAFIDRHFQRFKGHFGCKHDKRGNAIPGLEGIYSMKRLSEKMQ